MTCFLTAKNEKLIMDYPDIIENSENRMYIPDSLLSFAVRAGTLPDRIIQSVTHTTDTGSEPAAFFGRGFFLHAEQRKENRK